MQFAGLVAQIGGGMSPVLLGFGFSLGTAIIVILGDYVIKVAADGNLPLTSRYMLLGCGLYAFSAVLWYFAMRHVTLAQAGVAYSMLTLVALAIIGAVSFDEPIGQREFVGLGLALAAMMVMSHTA